MATKRRIAFQGEPGANSHLAIHEAYAGDEAVPCATFEDAFSAVSGGDCALAMIPIENSVDIGTGTEQDLKNPDILTYQANIRATLPVATSPIRPYVTAGAGAMTFLSNTEANRYPQMSETQTAFAANAGVGALIPLNSALLLRADFRQFVAFPQDDAVGLSDGSTADEIWTPRGTLGLTYQF